MLGKTFLVEPEVINVRNLAQIAEYATGVVYIHAAPVALCPHVEWALSSTLNVRAQLKWSPQDAEPGMQRATADWVGPAGTAARLVTALREWSSLRFEVTEDPGEGVDGLRFSYVPGLGLWHGSTAANGDVILGEMQIRALMDAQPDGRGLAGELNAALGTAWDNELENYRLGSVGAEATWLAQRVG